MNMDTRPFKHEDEVLESYRRRLNGRKLENDWYGFIGDILLHDAHTM